MEFTTATTRVCMTAVLYVIVVLTTNARAADADGGASTQPEQELPLFRRRPAIRRFVAEPTKVAPGASTELTWSTRRAHRCILQGEGEVDVSGKKIVMPDQSRAYVLRCINNQGHRQRKVFVEVTASPAPASAPSDTTGDGEAADAGAMPEASEVPEVSEGVPPAAEEAPPTGATGKAGDGEGASGTPAGPPGESAPGSTAPTPSPDLPSEQEAVRQDFGASEESAAAINRRTWGIVSGVTGGALLGCAGLFVYLARDTQERIDVHFGPIFQAARGHAQEIAYAQLKNAERVHNQQVIAAWTFAGLGAASLAGSAYLLFVAGGDDAPAPQVWLSGTAGGAFAGLRGRF